MSLGLFFLAIGTFLWLWSHLSLTFQVFLCYGLLICIRERIVISLSKVESNDMINIHDA